MGRRESLPDLHHVAAADPNLPGNQNPLERHAHLFLRAWRAQLRGLWRGMLRQSTHDKAKSGKARAAGKLLRETAGRPFRISAPPDGRPHFFAQMFAQMIDKYPYL